MARLGKTGLQVSHDSRTLRIGPRKWSETSAVLEHWSSESSTLLVMGSTNFHLDAQPFCDFFKTQFFVGYAFHFSF